jgi:lipopolysaccharide biosynthesis glycosyltransferase
MVVNIAYSSSNSYMKCTGVSILSLYENNKNIRYLNVYVITSNVTDENILKLQHIANTFNRKIEFVNASDKLCDLGEKFGLEPFRGSFAVYSTLIMDDIFPLKEKILVIDSDTIINGSIIDLWETNIEKHVIALVPEVGLYGKINSSEDDSILFKHNIYYNTGVLLFNLKKWRNDNISELLISGIKTYKKRFRIFDQSIINYLLNDKILRLKVKYNFYTAVHGISYSTLQKNFNQKKVFSESEFIEARNNPVIVHFTGFPFERPWYKKGITPYNSMYRNYIARSPWAKEELEKLPKNENLILQFYYTTARLLRKLGFYNLYHWYRYVLGQKLKQKLDVIKSSN